MIECLETNKICPVGNQKCKQCHLDNCKEVIKMIETQEEREERYALNELKKQLPEECKNCTIINILDIKNKIVYCPYRVEDRCVIE